MDEKLIARFWRRVDVKPCMKCCWPRRGGTFRGGYNAFKWGHNNRPAHVFSYTISKGPIPDGLQVRHTCDNPPCVNPNHLILGTHMDNMRDKIERDRNAKGEANGFSKLTAAQALAIREGHASGRSFYKLAAEFGVSHRLIGKIVKRVLWAHI